MPVRNAITKLELEVKLIILSQLTNTYNTETNLGDIDNTETNLGDIDNTDTKLGDIDNTETKLGDIDNTETKLGDMIIPKPNPRLIVIIPLSSFPHLPET